MPWTDGRNLESVVDFAGHESHEGRADQSWGSSRVLIDRRKRRWGGSSHGATCHPEEQTGQSEDSLPGGTADEPRRKAKEGNHFSPYPH